MKVVEIPQYGIEHLRVAERPTPEPGHGQVLLKMKAATLNYRDLMTVNGGYGPRLCENDEAVHDSRHVRGRR